MSSLTPIFDELIEEYPRLKNASTQWWRFEAPPPRNVTPIDVARKVRKKRK